MRSSFSICGDISLSVSVINTGELLRYSLHIRTILPTTNQLSFLPGEYLKLVRYFIGNKYGDNLLHNLKKNSSLQFFINGVKSQSISGSDHLGDQVRDLLDAIHLLSQVLGLQEVTEMGVIGILAHLVEVQETLVHLICLDYLLKLSYKILSTAPSSQDPGLLAWPLEQSPTPWLLVCKCLGIRPSHLSSPGQQFKYQYYRLNQSAPQGWLRAETFIGWSIIFTW